MKNSKHYTLEEQEKIAKEILENEVRPQIEHHERVQKTKSSSATQNLSSAQKAYLACNHQH